MTLIAKKDNFFFKLRSRRFDLKQIIKENKKQGRGRPAKNKSEASKKPKGLNQESEKSFKEDCARD